MSTLILYCKLVSGHPLLQCSSCSKDVRRLDTWTCKKAATFYVWMYNTIIIMEGKMPRSDRVNLVDAQCTVTTPSYMTQKWSHSVRYQVMLPQAMVTPNLLWHEELPSVQGGTPRWYPARTLGYSLVGPIHGPWRNITFPMFPQNTLLHRDRQEPVYYMHLGQTS